MKKLLFLLLALAWAAAFTACSKDEIPDPNAPTGLPALSDPNDVGSCMDDEAFREYCLKEFDTDKDGNVLTLMDIVADEGDFVEDLEQEARAKEVREALERLEEREKEILILRYGIYGGKPLTQREIAAKLNISRSYVSRIEKKAVEKLKEEFDARY